MSGHFAFLSDIKLDFISQANSDASLRLSVPCERTPLKDWNFNFWQSFHSGAVPSTLPPPPPVRPTIRKCFPRLSSWYFRHAAKTSLRRRKSLSLKIDTLAALPFFFFRRFWLFQGWNWRFVKKINRRNLRKYAFLIYSLETVYTVREFRVWLVECLLNVSLFK